MGIGYTFIRKREIVFWNVWCEVGDIWREDTRSDAMLCILKILSATIDFHASVLRLIKQRTIGETK